MPNSQINAGSQEHPDRLVTRPRPQLAAGVGDLGVHGFGSGPQQSRYGFAAVMRGDIPHDLAFPVGQKTVQIDGVARIG